VSKKPVAKKAESRKSKGMPFDVDKIIKALSGLKKKRKYPAWPEEISSTLSSRKSKIGSPEAILKSLTTYLKGLSSDGVLMPSRKERRLAYIIAGDDTRYSRKLDDTLKFELLAEIERLKGQLLEMQATLTVSEPTDATRGRTRAEVAQELEEEVFRRIAVHSRNRNRRTIDIWEVRRVLPEVPPETLDKVLEDLGTSWRIELQPVQDSTKLSAEEKGTLLKLADGTLIGALAIASD
jgi:hypothetical protein